jgi:SAM-dependent methyltransferase
MIKNKMNAEEKEARKIYNKVAETYHFFRTKKYPSGWFYNELLEMPSVFELLGNVKGKKILDFGCGTGIYAKILTDRGAIVKGFDVSEKMIKIAKRDNPKLDLRVGSGYKIPFKEKFDIVIACLVLDYFSDWNIIFKQISSVLNKNGIFIFSIGNPVSECCNKVIIKNRKLRVLGKINYFDEKKTYIYWKASDGKAAIKRADLKVPKNHKTYETIINTILRNGFEIIGYKDTFPLKKSKKLFPKQYQKCSKIPHFCVWKIIKNEINNAK